MRETLIALGVLVLTVGAYGRPSPTLLDNGELVQHSQFKGRPKWNLIPFLWTDKSVNITCEFTKDFKVYTAPSLEALSDKVSAKESVWCGWHNFLGQHSCVARLSPFGPVHVAVEHNSVATQQCTVELEEHVSYFMIAQTIAGVLLFLFASQLSASMFFRLGTGSAGVMLLSVLILLFLLSRTLPSKRSAAAMFAVFGSSFTGLVRYVFGQWIPSFEQLICNKVVLVYLALSGLVGLATTYYFDREDNVRLHNILKYGLKLVGLGLMAFSTSMPEASVTLCCILLLSQLVQPVLFLWNKGEVSERTLSELVSESPALWRRSKPRRRVPGVSRLKPKADTLGWETPEATQAEAEDEFEDGEELELSPSSEESSERTFLQAAKMPLPGEERHPAAASSEYKREIGSPAARLPTGASDHDSPWIKRGLALNLETGRTVKIHGSTWNKLMAQGYQLDRQQGTLTPPVKAKQGSASATPSPASRVKARRS